MKGSILSILMVVVLCAVLVIVALPFVSGGKTMVEEEEGTLSKIFEPIFGYKFNEQDLFVDLNDSNIATNANTYFHGDLPGICEDLANCIIDSAKHEGRPCLITEIDFNNSHPSGITSGPISEIAFDCSNYNGNGEVIETRNKINRTVCSLIEIDQSVFYGAFGYEEDVFGDSWPNIHGCYIPNEFKLEIEHPDYWVETEDNLVTRKNFLFFPPYYESYLSSYNYYDDTGFSTRIYLSNATVGDGGECQYNIFVCGQPAIAQTREGRAYNIFEHFRSKITQDLSCCKELPATSTERYITNLSNTYIRPYEFDFTGETDKPTLYQIVAAIDAGLWEWNKLNYNNKELINNILNENVLPIDLTADYVHFHYTPLTTYMLTSTDAYPDCYDFNSLETSLNTLANIQYSHLWTDGFDTSYDKLVMTMAYQYSIETGEFPDGGDSDTDPDIKNILVITPHISICRDK